MGCYKPNEQIVSRGMTRIQSKNGLGFKYNLLSQIQRIK